MKIKTRFAPSPTGYLHIGGARTALYSWLFARSNGGDFILRIEDTDVKRSTPEAIHAIISSMNWLGLKWDDGPYFQTMRLDRYNMIIDKMIKENKAYRCFCSKERLEDLRKKQLERGDKPRYDGKCRYNYIKNYNKDKPCVIRFANPLDGLVTFNDQVMGNIKFNNKELDDLIIRRIDGLPTYNFCAVIDDMDMKITHVIRGKDHINNTPRQINIFKALNALVPTYAHISMINGDDGKKLSKRNGAVSIMHYHDSGYLPEALLNYLVRLGWSNGNKEIFSIKEMIKLFSLKKINKSNSIFDIKKLLWLNHYYINKLPAEYVANHLKWHLKKTNINIKNGPNLSELVKILGKNCKTLTEIVDNCRYFYEDPNISNTDIIKNYLCIMAIQPMKIIKNKLLSIKYWDIKSINNIILETADELKIEIRKVCMPIRIALTGAEKSPAIDTIIYVIGKDRSINRINKALEFIKKFK